MRSTTISLIIEGPFKGIIGAHQRTIIMASPLHPIKQTKKKQKEKKRKHLWAWSVRTCDLPERKSDQDCNLVETPELCSQSSATWYKRASYSWPSSRLSVVKEATFRCQFRKMASKSRPNPDNKQWSKRRDHFKWLSKPSLVKKTEVTSVQWGDLSSAHTHTLHSP